jgi:uncharacterized protein YecE (DUF72 family)
VDQDQTDQLELWREKPESTVASEQAPISPLVRFGTSTWTYPGWQGIVYHKHYSPRRFKQDCLAEYARYEYNGQQLFRTVGFDFSFYGPPKSEQLAEFAAQLPEGFEACSKVWEEITIPLFPSHPRYGAHAGEANPHFLDAEYFVEQVLPPYAAAFKDHTGPFIFEFQRTGIERDEFLTKLDVFLAPLPKEYRYAVEVRHASLLHEDYHAILRAHGVAHVYNHWTHMPPLAQQHELLGRSFTAPFTMIRVLTPVGMKYEDAVKAFEPYNKIVRPNPQMRRDVIELIRHGIIEARPTYAIINNRSEGSAPLTIQAIVDQMQRTA